MIARSYEHYAHNYAHNVLTIPLPKDYHEALGWVLVALVFAFGWRLHKRI
jgi:hypothetical protein